MALASPQLISTVTDAVSEEVGHWQTRPIDPLYALVFFDALRVEMRDEGTVRNKAVYLAIGVIPEVRKMIYTADEINKPFLYLATSRRRYSSSTRLVLRSSTHATSSDSSYDEAFLGAAA